MKIYDKKIETMKRDAMRALQLKRLKEMVAYAYARVPFYKKKYDEAEKYLKVGAKRKVLESPHFLGDLYMALYRFDEAVERYEEYAANLEKAKKQVPDSIQEAIGLLGISAMMLYHARGMSCSERINFFVGMFVVC